MSVNGMDLLLFWPPAPSHPFGASLHGGMRMDQFQVGDLVIIIRSPRCPKAAPDANVGEIFVVQEIKTTRGACGYCQEKHPPRSVKCARNERGQLVPSYRLKRIPPLPPEFPVWHAEMTLDEGLEEIFAEKSKKG